MEVPVELSRIVISEHSDQQTIFLREKGGDRSFPIVIGIAEAYAIDRRLKKYALPRPMTHDLLASVIEAMDGRLEKIVINDIRKLHASHFTQTFIATLHIRRDSELIEVDSRPSDAIALGVGLETPIFVAEHVMETVTSNHPTAEEQVDMLRARVTVLGERIAKIKARLVNEEFLSKSSKDLIEQHRVKLKEMQAERKVIETVLKKIK